MDLELGVETHRRESPLRNGSTPAAMQMATLFYR